MCSLEFGVWSFHRHGLYIAHCVLMTESSFSRAFAFQLGFTSSEGALLSHLIEGALLPKILYPTGETGRYLPPWNPVWAHARRFHPPKALGHRVFGGILLMCVCVIMCVCMCMYVCVCENACVRASACVYVCICMCTCMCVYAKDTTYSCGRNKEPINKTAFSTYARQSDCRDFRIEAGVY